MLKIIHDSWKDFENIVQDQIGKDTTINVLEIGGGANPFISELQVIAHNLQYTVIDIDQDELDKSKSRNLKKICRDISESASEEKFDFIFSKMVLEHVKNPLKFHNSIVKMMHNETIVCHFFAAKYGLPSILNIILPDALTNYVVYKVQGRDPQSEGKFKAYYRKCTGPLNNTRNWFGSLGYQIEDYRGYIGHGYLGKYKVLGKIERSFSKFVLWLNSPLLTSNAILTLKKIID